MSPGQTIKFCDKIKVAMIIDHNHCIESRNDEIIKEKRTARAVRSVYPHLQWQQPKQQRVTTGTVPVTNRFAFTTTNKFNGLEDDTLDEYGNYNSSWMLDTAASGNYADKNTPVGNKQEITHGISVSCANDGIMQQTAEGELPFDNIPDGAKDAQIFKKMQKPLISGGKLVTNGANTVFDVPNAHTCIDGGNERSNKKNYSNC